jgi:hypothetical protein
MNINTDISMDITPNSACISQGSPEAAAFSFPSYNTQSFLDIPGLIRFHKRAGISFIAYKRMVFVVDFFFLTILQGIFTLKNGWRKLYLISRAPEEGVISSNYFCTVYSALFVFQYSNFFKFFILDIYYFNIFLILSKRLSQDQDRESTYNAPRALSTINTINRTYYIKTKFKQTKEVLN